MWPFKKRSAPKDAKCGHCDDREFRHLPGLICTKSGCDCSAFLPLDGRYDERLVRAVEYAMEEHCPDFASLEDRRAAALSTIWMVKAAEAARWPSVSNFQRARSPREIESDLVAVVKAKLL